MKYNVTTPPLCKGTEGEVVKSADIPFTPQASIGRRVRAPKPGLYVHVELWR